MKLRLIILLFILNPLNVFSRGQDPRGELGGVKVEDPFKDINKSGKTRGDREKANEIMAQLGYGSFSKKPEVKKKEQNTKD